MTVDSKEVGSAEHVELSNIAQSVKMKNIS